MKYRIDFLPEASEDIKAIEDWYILHFSIDSAKRVKNTITGALRRLETFPESGSIPKDEWIREQGFRMVISGHFIAFYKIIGDAVYVYHIADSRIDYRRLFD